MRNPDWTWEELLLALDLYFDIGVASARHPQVVELSDVLNALPIHTVRPDKDKFRNPNAVNLKLANFSRLDPTYEGAGMKSGARLEEGVWDHFRDRRQELKGLATGLRIEGKAGLLPQLPEPDEAEVEALAQEGRLAYRLHRVRERSPDLVRRRKEQELKRSGHLACEVCGFDFEESFGDLGAGYIECHHTQPLSVSGETRTRLADLALLCANCHRMIHRTNPWLKPVQLRAVRKAHA